MKNNMEECGIQFWIRIKIIVMDKKDIIIFLDRIFTAKGYRKRGSTWKYKGLELEKVIRLQKSRYSDLYYLNYGFIIIGLDLNKLEMHVDNGLSSLDDAENERIIDLLDLGNNILDEYRKSELKRIVEDKLLKELTNINTKKELVSSLKNRPHLNDIPLIVKHHLNIE
ncbi:DUF4304 domain-containing protein [Marinilabiliaceae bacterium JC040]|nr:DUF4304 domain-containing protein [Marinilabiliaceae bacterium JC040]